MQPLLVTLRKKLNTSQEVLAYKTGIPRHVITQHERGLSGDLSNAHKIEIKQALELIAFTEELRLQEARALLIEFY